MDPHMTRFMLSLALLLATFPAAAQESRQVRIAPQFGIAYLPLYVVKEQRLLEAKAVAAGLPEPRVEWLAISGAAAMNDGLLSGSIEFVTAGVTPMITVWDRTRSQHRVRGVASLGSMPNYLLTNNQAIMSPADFTEKDRIALPSARIGFQATLIQMASERAFGPGRFDRLDGLSISMPHPDATALMLSGRTEITAHFTSPPFQQRQLENPRIRKLVSSYDLLGGPHTFNVVYATGRFVEANPRTTRALVEALDQANEWIAANPRAAAELYLRAEPSSSTSVEFIQSIVTDPEIRFTTTPEKSQVFADFQFRTGQIRERPAAWKDIFFPVLHDKPGS
jgi:NitT/TauT family transport system substrate-binding protein